MYRISVYKVLSAIALIGVLAAVAASCRSTKNIRKVIATPVSRQDTTGAAARAAAAPVRDLHADSMQVIRSALQQLDRNRIDFQTFSAHMKVHYEESDGKDYHLNAVIHIKKDSIIWLEVDIGLGIPGFRMLITRDSVKILDKLKKIIRLRSVNFLRDQVHLPIDFKALQDLLIGNPIFLDTNNILYYKNEPGAISLNSIGSVFRNYLTLNNDRTLQHIKLDDINPAKVGDGDMVYGDYDNSGQVPFSRYRRISVVTKSKVDIEIEYSKVRFNDVLSYTFSIPKNYKRR